MMEPVTLHAVQNFPEPAFSALAREAFSSYEQSELLSAVLDDELTVQASNDNSTSSGVLRLVAFRGDTLVGWSHSQPQGSRILYMANSGVAASERRQGIYSQFVQKTIEHARSQSFVSILSRHAAADNAVIVAKLKLGFFVSGFEYSEVYGPLVRLTYLVRDKRRELYDSRSQPIRRAEHGE